MVRLLVGLAFRMQAQSGLDTRGSILVAIGERNADEHHSRFIFPFSVFDNIQRGQRAESTSL
jgi:hypothetical protein